MALDAIAGQLGGASTFEAGIGLIRVWIEEDNDPERRLRRLEHLVERLVYVSAALVDELVHLLNDSVSNGSYTRADVLRIVEKLSLRARSSGDADP